MISYSPEETMQLAGKFGKSLQRGDIICLEGNLGAGKTTFVKGLAAALRVKPADVTSPTFIIMNYYEGKLPIYHFDFYRLENPKDIASVDYDEYFYGNGISIVEWPERLGEAMPPEYWRVRLEHRGEHEREIRLSAKGEQYLERLKKVQL